MTDMNYCETCMALVEGGCPLDGHSVRTPQPNDPVLLLKAGSLQAGMMEELLHRAAIPVMKKGRLGAGMTAWAGSMLEELSLFVPWGAYEQAKELVDSLQETDKCE